MFIVAIDPLDARSMLKEPRPKLPSRLPFQVPTSAGSAEPREGGLGDGVGAVGVELAPFPPQAVSVRMSAAHVVAFGASPRRFLFDSLSSLQTGPDSEYQEAESPGILHRLRCPDCAASLWPDGHKRLGAMRGERDRGLRRFKAIRHSAPQAEGAGAIDVCPSPSSRPPRSPRQLSQPE